MAMVGLRDRGAGSDFLGCLLLDTLSLEWKIKRRENLEATWQKWTTRNAQEEAKNTLTKLEWVKTNPKNC